MSLNMLNLAVANMNNPDLKLSEIQMLMGTNISTSTDDFEDLCSLSVAAYSALHNMLFLMENLSDYGKTTINMSETAKSLNFLVNMTLAQHEYTSNAGGFLAELQAINSSLKRS